MFFCVHGRCFCWDVLFSVWVLLLCEHVGVAVVVSCNDQQMRPCDGPILLNLIYRRSLVVLLWPTCVRSFVSMYCFPRGGLSWASKLLIVTLFCWIFAALCSACQCSQPNAIARIVSLDSTKKIIIVAKRHIKPGEEVRGSEMRPNQHGRGQARRPIDHLSVACFSRGRVFLQLERKAIAASGALENATAAAKRAGGSGGRVRRSRSVSCLCILVLDLGLGPFR